MYQVRLDEWYGRLGNNLSQLINIIDYCERNKYVFVQQDTIFTHAEKGPIYDGLTDFKNPTKDLHSFIRDFIVNFSDDISVTIDNINEKCSNKIIKCFYDADIPVPNNKKAEILQKYILPNFNYTELELDTSTLVIHIRSGDIMKEGCHGFYVQPPYNFYKKVIDENNYKKIIIVTEPDKKNPAIQMIQDNYPNVVIQTTNLYDDVSIILSAKNFLCNSQGTFGHMLALMSTNIKKLYIPYYLNPRAEYYNDNSFLKSADTKIFFDMTNITHINVYEYLIFNYIAPFSWNPGNKEQIELLKRLPIEDIFKISLKTASFNDIPSYTLDEYNIYEIKNVKSILYHHTLYDKSMYPFGYDIELSGDLSGDLSGIIENYYFFMDTLFNEAFAHWVFESGIYLPLFKKIKEKYPNIKIYFKEIKGYKLALLKGFDIDEYVTEIKPNNIICFPTYQSFHIFLPEYTNSNDIIIDSKYINYLDRFYKSLNKEYKKDIDILYLPRGIKENFKGNDRTINIQNELINYINILPNSKILYTDTVTNFNEQLEIISRAKVIILDYGSSLNVNGFFANDSNIIVLGYDIHHIMQQILYYVFNETIKRNKVRFIYNKSNNKSNNDRTINIDLNEVIDIIQKTLKENFLHTQEN